MIKKIAPDYLICKSINQAINKAERLIEEGVSLNRLVFDDENILLGYDVDLGILSLDHTMNKYETVYQFKDLRAHLSKIAK
ncbi:MAG: hypothetical protein ACK5Z2_01370 [Bacteroidota bacterium]|jgi:hypothetical protein